MSCSENRCGQWYCCECDVLTKEANHEQTQFFRTYLANIITDLLLGQLSEVLIERFLRRDYQYFLPSERQKIIQNVRQSLEKNCTENQLLRHLQVFHRVDEYLSDNRQLCLEGFLFFRLKEYLKEIHQTIDQAVSDFLVEQEYESFIELLCDFADVQTPKIDEVNILSDVQGKLFLLDEKMERILPEQLKNREFISGTTEEYEDWLLGALITVAPRKIILHIREEHRLLQTITDVFKLRTIICSGCCLCNQSGEGKE